jgi:hypothetical protein
MPECAWRNALGEAGTTDSDPQGALHGGVIEGTEWVVGAREEQTRWAGLAHGLEPPLAQQLESDGRQRSVAILVTLGLTDVEQHPSRVDVLDTKPADLAQAETGRVQDGDEHAVAQRAELCEDGEYLIEREDDGIVLLAAAVRDAEEDQVGPIHDVEVEEAESADGLIEQAVRNLLLIAKEEEVPLDVGQVQTIGRAMKEEGEARDQGDVGARCPRRKIAYAEGLEHSLTQGSRDHDRSPFNEIRSVDSQRELRGERSSTHLLLREPPEERGARRGSGFVQLNAEPDVDPRRESPKSVVFGVRVHAG